MLDNFHNLLMSAYAQTDAVLRLHAHSKQERTCACRSTIEFFQEELEFNVEVP